MAIGVTALAALLGAGAYIITDHVTQNRAEPAEVGALAVPDASAMPETVAASGSAGASSAAPQPSGSASAGASASASAEVISPEVLKSIEAAREQMRKEGVEIQRPVVPKATTTAADIQMTTKGSLKEGGIVRMITARGDLTGQRELAYVAGGVAKHRNVPCTQTFKFSTNPAPAKRANLLMCWRTSAKKSVIAMVVDPKGHPSRDKAVDAIAEKWRSMG